MSMDPFPQPGIGGPTQLTDLQPEGMQIELNEDGSAKAHWPNAPGGLETAGHYDNLAEFLPEERLAAIVNDLLEAIEQDKQAREERDRQYEKGLNLTGMGSNVVGGADFPGASRAVHPVVLEAAIDFGGRVMTEMFPPDGPVKAHVIGDETPEKVERGERVARYMNWQLTELMPSAYHEFEVGMSQCPLGGAFYTKGYEENGKPAVSFIPIDHVYRPWNDGDFYSQPRITHRQNVDKWTFRENVRSGLWCDVVDFETRGGTLPEETQADQANARIIGVNQPGINVDSERLVYESSIVYPLESDEDDAEPLLITIDVDARKVLGLYRNTRETDKNRERLTFLIEWPFWPWRGGYPVGMTHMIGSLSEAATGSLRALLDSAHLNNSQTMVRIKGGSSSGGQTLKPRQTEITEIAGSLLQDDVRKTVMPLTFNPPNNTLYQLLGFVVDAARGVVRTTFDEYDKMNGQTPVGTAQMFIEQGLSNFGSVHGRLHRSLRRFLKWLYQVNADTLTPQTVMDQLGELTVRPEDFQGPMIVIPVSDPRIYSDIQRKAMAQTVATRALQAPPGIYQVRKTEAYFLKQYGVPDPDAFLVPDPQPKRINAVAENVTASTNGAIKAFPGQDHESHINIHVAYLQSELFGASASIAPLLIPKMIGHLGEHQALWYSDAMLEAVTAAIREKTGNPMITLESFMMQGVEVPLDKLMAELDDEVLALAQQKMADVPKAIMAARDLLKKLAPPAQMDPSAVAMEDVQRQKEADKRKAEFQVVDLQAKRAEKQEANSLKAMQDRQAAALKQYSETIKRDLGHRELDIREQEVAAGQATAYDDMDVREGMNQEDNATAVEIAEMKTTSAEEVAEARVDSQPPGGSNAANS